MTYMSSEAPLDYQDEPLQALTVDNWSSRKVSLMTPENRACFAKIIRTQLRGLGNLPYGLGLDKNVYAELLQAIDIEALTQMDDRWHQQPSGLRQSRSDVINQLANLRMAERNTLVELFIHHAAEDVPFCALVAVTLATACLSSAHLWKALGLDSRQELRQWLSHNFPSLAAANTENMRWKRFFYLQLCKGEGDYVCLSPSCDECTSYSECFVTD